jgi:hypothetical protein
MGFWPLSAGQQTLTVANQGQAQQENVADGSGSGALRHNVNPARCNPGNKITRRRR